MAAGTIRRPDGKTGPCADPKCGHRDCDETRALVATACRFCGEPIGYDRRFYSDGGSFVHAACLEEAVAQERT